MGTAITKRSQIDVAQVRAAVEAAERQTSAEIVVALSPFFFGNVMSAAHRAFRKLGVARTRQRNGVLIFVVPRRRQVVVLADEGALVAAPGTLWSELAADIAAACGRGAGTDGLVAAIARLGRELAAAFPCPADDVNELPDAPRVAFRAGPRTARRSPS